MDVITQSVKTVHYEMQGEILVCGKENDNQSVTECTKNVTIYGVRHTFGRERVAGLIRPSPQAHLSWDTFATRHIARCHIFLLTHSSCGTIGTPHTMTVCSFVQ